MTPRSTFAAKCPQPVTVLGLTLAAALVSLSGCGSTPIDQPRERVAEINAMEHAEKLVSILRDDGLPINRAAAATALARIDDPVAVTPLIEGLADADAGVRRDCAHALGALGDVQATRPLCELLVDDPVVGVRRACARALHDLAEALKGSADNRQIAEDSLVAALGDPNESVVYNSYRALIEITGRTDLGRSAGEWAELVDRE